MKESPKTFKDGSSVKKSANAPNKWIAMMPDITPLVDDENRMRYFDTEDEAVAALVAAGHERA